VNYDIAEDTDQAERYPEHPLYSSASIGSDIFQPHGTMRPVYADQSFWEFSLLEEVIAGKPTKFVAKEVLIKQIENIPTRPEFYDEDECPPDSKTREDAKNIILEITPSGLLAGADVYGYYGGVSIAWETQRRKVKLTIPPHQSQKRPTIYHGTMREGSVIDSRVEPDVDAAVLWTWLSWLQE
jgi:hypothetical protein